jgi:hypothetical protein
MAPWLAVAGPRFHQLAALLEQITAAACDLSLRVCAKQSKTREKAEEISTQLASGT